MLPSVRKITFLLSPAILFICASFGAPPASSEELSDNIYETVVEILERRCNPPVLPEEKAECWDEPIGTGTIVARNSDVHYVLTAKHVVDNPTDYSIRTLDGATRAVNEEDIVKLQDDLAVIAFSDTKAYSIATLYTKCFYASKIESGPLSYEASSDSAFCSNSKDLTDLSSLFVLGYPIRDADINGAIKVTAGRFVDRNPNSLEAQIPYQKGYELLYTNDTNRGMSGSPIFDVNGQLIGVHGQSEKELFSGVPFGYSVGIPIDFFLRELNEIFSDNDATPMYSSEGLEVITGDLQSSSRLAPFDRRGTDLFYDYLFITGVFTPLLLDAFSEPSSPKCSDIDNDVRQMVEIANRLYRTLPIDEAIECINRAVDIAPNSPSVLFAKGFLLMRADQLPESLDVLTTLIKQDINHADEYIVWRWMGVVQNKMGDYRSALESFSEAAKIYREQTRDTYPQAWSSIFTTVDSLISNENEMAVDWSLYREYNDIGDKFHQLRLYSLSKEAYRTAQQLGENEERSKFGLLKVTAAVEQTLSLRVLSNNVSVSHIDPMWYYSYLLKYYTDVLQNAQDDDTLNRQLDSALEITLESGSESHPFSQAQSALVVYMSNLSEIWEMAEAGSAAVVDSEISDQLTNQYMGFYNLVEELKRRELYNHAFHLCSLSAAFHFDILNYSYQLQKTEGKGISASTPVEVSCVSQISTIRSNRDSILGEPREGVIAIEVEAEL